MFRNSKKRAVISAVSILTMSILLSSCSSGEKSGETSAEVETAVAEPAASVPAEACAAASVPAEASAAAPVDALATAWAEDWGRVGLTNPGLTETDAGIVETDTTQFKKESPFTIGFASQGPTNSLAVIYDENMKARAAELGVPLEYAGADGKEDKQVNDINDLIAKGVDAIIVTPMGPAIKGPIERAAAQGIPVILCTGAVDTTMAVARVDRDGRLDGAIFAEWIAQQIGGKGKIVMLNGIAGVPTTENRKAGAEEVFALYPDIEILDRQYTNWSPTEGKKVMEQLLTKYGDEIDAIWSDSANQDIGVIQAYNEAGKEIPPITGEPLNGFLKLAKENAMKFVAIGYPPSHSAECLDAAVAALGGKPVSSFVNVKVPMFTDADIDKYLRKDCSDDLWVPTDALINELLASLKLC